MSHRYTYLSIGFGTLLFVIWFFILQSLPHDSGKLKVAFLDIGQGDAIYIEAPNGNQMIIDGGPGIALMNKLPEVLPWGDKTIDTVVITNPDADHYSGLIPLFEQYAVASVVEPGTRSETSLYQTLEEHIILEHVPHLLATRGMEIILDSEKHISYEILFPDRDVSTWETNDGSIVGKLTYGDTSFLLMGDATILTEGIVVAENKNTLDTIDVLKLGHHGSRTSSGNPILTATTPDVAIISAGLNNKYGHPHQEVIDRLLALHIPYLTTFKEGTIICESDSMDIICQ
ncbi:MBL fold metallo-hydrolase [Candidatus Nomurabacteria bacterium]|nr:MAG: MBL fold metallo-hydrolase [Candidatus Nomurabacteria bacterium]